MDEITDGENPSVRLGLSHHLGKSHLPVPWVCLCGWHPSCPRELGAGTKGRRFGVGEFGADGP